MLLFCSSGDLEFRLKDFLVRIQWYQIGNQQFLFLYFLIFIIGRKKRKCTPVIFQTLLLTLNNVMKHKFQNTGKTPGKNHGKFLYINTAYCDLFLWIFLKWYLIAHVYFIYFYF